MAPAPHITRMYCIQDPEVIKVYGSTVKLVCEEWKVERTLQKHATYITMQKNHRTNSSKAPAILNLHGTVNFTMINLVFIDGGLGSKNKCKKSFFQEEEFKVHLRMKQRNNL